MLPPLEGMAGGPSRVLQGAKLAEIKMKANLKEQRNQK